MSEYISAPKSRQEIRHIANTLREKLHLENELCFPVVEMLDIMSKVFPDFSYEIVEDDDLPEDIHAEMDVITGHIRIKEIVYVRACKGEGRDRMTIAHEIGHYILVYFKGVKIFRNHEKRELKAYEDPEWQAKCFAGELLIPKHLVNGMEFYNIIEKCRVSYEAAEFQCEKYKAEDPAFYVL